MAKNSTSSPDEPNQPDPDQPDPNQPDEPKAKGARTTPVDKPTEETQGWQQPKAENKPFPVEAVPAH